jgi:hypothetical protein
MNDEKWIDNLRTHLADYEQPSPEGLWEAVVREMDSKGRPAVLPLRRRAGYWAGRVASVAAVVAIALFVGRNTFHSDRAGLVVQSAQVEKLAPTDEASPEQDIPQNNYPTKNQHNIIPKPTPVSEAEISEAGEEERVPEELPTDELPAEVPAIPAETTETVPAKERPTIIYSDNEALMALLETPRPKRDKWSASLLASNVPGANSKSSQAGYGALSAATPAPEMYGDDVSLMNPMTEFMIRNRSAQTHTETTHRQPVRAGVMVRYALTERLGIEGGVAYTYLESKLKSGSDNLYYETEQSLHYLGIPINLNYTLWRNNLLNLYVSGGGMVERSVSGSASTKYVEDGRVVSTDNRSLGVAGVQWSVNAAAGLQLDLSPTFGLFVEPGIGYHFDNGRPVETIYKTQPLNFNLSLGLRISFDK